MSRAKRMRQVARLEKKLAKEKRLREVEARLAEIEAVPYEETSDEVKAEFERLVAEKFTMVKAPILNFTPRRFYRHRNPETGRFEHLMCYQPTLGTAWEMCDLCAACHYFAGDWPAKKMVSYDEAIRLIATGDYGTPEEVYDG